MKITHLSLVLILFAVASCSLPASSDPCLQGDWVMSNEDLNTMLLTLVPLPNLSIPAGTFQLKFEGEEFVYGSDAFTLQMGMPDGYLSAEASFAVHGTFSAADGTLTFSDVVISRNISHWVAVIDGNVTDAPGSYDVSFPAPGSGPYTCSDHLLTITALAPSGEPFAMIFTR